VWLRDGKVKAADARLNQTVLDVSDKALRLVADVKATHARIAFGERALALSDENLATIRQSIDSLDARVRGGEGRRWMSTARPPTTGQSRSRACGSSRAT
jgi:outer membrane protein TolC